MFIIWIIILSFITLFLIVFLTRRISTSNSDDPICYAPDLFDLIYGILFLVLAILCCAFCPGPGTTHQVTEEFISLPPPPAPAAGNSGSVRPVVTPPPVNNRTVPVPYPSS